MTELSETFKRLEQDPQGGSQHLLHVLETFLLPFLTVLDELLDKRLVRTLLQCLVAIIRLRNHPQALWLSERGSYLDGYDGYASSATAGTKRVGKLLRSAKWTVDVIDRYFLEKADEEVEKLKEQGKRILCLWDGSVLEKAESEKLEGLCPVLSSKAKRRGRTKRGLVFNWPALRPVRVMGMQWTAALIVGMQGRPHLALSRWWTTKGIFASKLRDTEEEALCICLRKWGPLLVHVFDRGYASEYWLQLLSKYRARFVIRWIKKHVFLTLAGEEKQLWQIGQGKKYRAHKEIWDSTTSQKMPCDIWWTAVRHPRSGELLYLVKARVKKGVMYLITNETVKTEAQAWDIFFSYRRRWQIETSFRYAKCELALECPRLWSLEARLKLLGMVMLVYAFLLSLLDPVHRELVQALLRFKCHRTGKRCQTTPAPLYRLRWALSRLWDDYHPRLTCFLPPSDGPFSIGSLISHLERFQKNWG
ncbi:MAG TPA: transposase [Ktedonobacteraceae bacterium]|nr:transposase [Ktedonobacteraceae bacterium]